MRTGWQVKRLGEICTIELGKTPSRGRASYWDPNRTSGNVWLSIADLLNTQGRVVSDSKEYISDAGAALCKPVKSGTLLLSFKLTLGRLAFCGRDLYTNEAIASLNLGDGQEILAEYLYYFLCGFDWMKASESDQKIKGRTLNKAKLKELPIAFPGVPEQRRIVAILDEALQGIAKAKENAERNLQDARELFESEREAVLSGINRGWSEAPLSDLCEVKHGYAFEGEFFATAGRHVLLTPGNFFESGGYRDRGDKQKYFIGNIPDGYVLPKASLLVAMTEQAAGLLGSPLLVPEPDIFLHNQRLGLVLAKDDSTWANEFFFHVFNLRRVRSEIHASASGVKVRHTSPSKICEIRVAFPATVAEQRAVAAGLFELAEECDRLASVYGQKLCALEELKKSVLQRAFTGALTARATDEQVAELA